MSSDPRFVLVELRGSPFEMGRQYGRQCRELIRDLNQRFASLILAPENDTAGQALVAETIAFVADAAPDLLREIEGIAEGAGLTVEEIFTLNCSVELFAWQGCLQNRSVNTVPPPDGCSSFLLHSDSGPLVAWNMDWWRVWQPSIVLLHGRPDHGPRFYAFAFAGCVGRPGMSERVAVAANYLGYRGGPQPGVDNQWDGIGVPYGLLSRVLLEQSSTAEVAEVLSKVRRMACLNYTVGDVDGDLRCFETTPTTFAELRPEADFLTHANSYLHPAYRGLTEDRLAQGDPRTWHAREQLRSAVRPLTRETLQSVQRSHFEGQTTGVCVHNKLQDKDGMSLLGFIAELSAETLWVAYGSPCEHAFVPYRL